jgi:tetratricopeptide (TPR) repeat protein
MFRRLKLMFMCLVAGLAIGPVHALQAQQAQEMQRFRVLIPDFQPLSGANKRFGEKAADQLRDLINTLPTHQPVPKKEIEASLKKYKMKMDQLDCIKTRQLAALMGAQVALCASYTSGTDGQYTVKAAFYNVATSEPFNLKDVSVPGDKAEQQAAQGIFDQFDRYNQQVRATAFCAQYAQSQQWDAALENCNKALALNPNSAGTHYQEAQILFQQKKYDEALAELKTVLSLNPAHDDALKLAGYIAATLGQNDDAEAYYTKYLELNPGSADVRMKIAYDLAKQGDPAGAMQLIQKGLDVAPNNVDLLEQYGGFAFSAGLAANQKANMNGDDPGPLTPEATDYFHKAIDAYQKVYAIKGEATPVAHLRNIIAAYVQLDELNQAITMAQTALKTHPKEDGLWSMYADALQRAGKVDDAIAALDSVKAINPEFPNVDLRQGKWLMDAGRVDDAVKVLSTVARSDSSQARTAAQLIFGDAYTKGISKKNWDYAVTGLSAAERLPNLDVAMTHQLNFWHGWSLFQTGMEEQKPGTVASAKASLPKFQEALRLFQNVGDYPRTAAKLDPKQLLDNTNTYIDIQKAIIKRGSRGG